MSTDGPTIRSLKARALNVPLERPIRTAFGTIPAAPLVLLDILTEEGISGHAYVFGYTPLTLAPLAWFPDPPGRRSRGHPAFTRLEVLFGCPTTRRASLPTSSLDL